MEHFGGFIAQVFQDGSVDQDAEFSVADSPTSGANT